MEAYNAKSEYDAFGPWIHELKDVNQLPPLFSSRYREKNDFSMLIEIPRNIERRSAVPGMDLYDTVIGTYEKYVYLLERREDVAVESRVRYGEIEMIEDYRNLLFGKLTIYTAGRKVEVLYNTVGGDSISRIVGMIRDRYAAKTYTMSRHFFNQQPDTEILYKNMLTTMISKGEAIDASVFQPAAAVNSMNQNFFHKLINILFNKTLLPSLHLSNSRELVIISRGKAFKHPEAVYSYATTYIPIEKIRDIRLFDSDVYSNIRRVDIQLGSYTQEYYLDSDNMRVQEYYMRVRDAIVRH